MYLVVLVTLNCTYISNFFKNALVGFKGSVPPELTGSKAVTKVGFPFRQCQQERFKFYSGAVF
jgi:hypothetical protein